MEIFEFKEILKNGLTQTKLLEEQYEQFYEYMNLLIEWNEKINLTAITEPKNIINKHFIDSLTILPYLKENNKIIDVGTGAGFPGLPIKIANPSLDITLLDSLNKRINFLEEVISKLQLQNIKAVHGRAEEYAKDNREIYDIAVSRAVAELPVLLEYLLPFVKVGGKCICMKGPKAMEEIEKSKKALDVLGGKIEKIENIQINGEMDRNIIIISKIKPTPTKYPRKAGKPSKEPII
ncbi:MAG: 16S rRNA (guanine(527)-N(7))-methyltransferase RsmG [Clostridia bacterium]|nr:16S rRNA (guanine(527)-N(7))-methyltransferase RsmG [Clostridia bacterium]